MNEQRYPTAINAKKWVTLYTIDCKKLEIASYYILQKMNKKLFIFSNLGQITSYLGKNEQFLIHFV